MEEGEGEGEAHRGHEGWEEGEKEREIAGKEVTIEELPETEDIEAAGPKEVAERYVQFETSRAAHHPREERASHSQR